MWNTRDHRLKHARILLYTGLMALTLSLLPPSARAAEKLFVLTNSAGQETAIIDSAGNFVLAGKFHEAQASITLDPAKQYWSIQNSDGVVVFAIEIETGDAYSTGVIRRGTTSISG